MLEIITVRALLLAPGVAPQGQVFQGQPQLRHYNPLGTVQGGWYAAAQLPTMR